MAEGWVSLHRQIREHWLWDDKPFSKGQAWVDILMMANHSNGRILAGNEIVDIEAGGFITSDEKLGNAWGWSRHKVRNFLDLLQADEMISVKRTTKGTAIFVTNYAKYRYCPTAEEHQKDIVGTSSGHRRDTNNNDNNNNNENKEIIELFSSVPSSNGGKVENSVLEADLTFHYKKLTERYGKKVLLEELRKQMETMNCIDDVYRFYGIRER